MPQQIKSLLKTTDEKQQQIGYLALKEAKYFSAPVKREIARDIIEMLDTLEPSTAGQSNSIKSILVNWKTIEDAVKLKFYDFIFDKLVIRSINPINIKLGFEVLYQLPLKYKEHYKYFENILERIKKPGEDPKIINEIKEGLRKLKLPANYKKKFNSSI